MKVKQFTGNIFGLNKFHNYFSLSKIRDRVPRAASLITHIHRHHKKYLFGFLGGWAIFKTILLIGGALGMLGTYAQWDIVPDYVLITNESVTGDTNQTTNETTSTRSATAGDEADLAENISNNGYNLIINNSTGGSRTDIGDTPKEKTRKNIKTFKFPKSKNKNTIKQDLRDSGFAERQDGKFKTQDNIDLSDSHGEILVPITIESPIDTGGQTIQVDIPEGTIFKDNNQNLYQDIVSAPQFLDPSQIQNSPANNSIAIIEVGTQNQEIHFEDQNQNPTFVDITVPVPGHQSGEKVNIYSSSDKSNWSLLTQAIIESSGEISYVTFKTPHFTAFMIGSDSFDFFIGDNGCTSETAETSDVNSPVFLCATAAKGNKGSVARMRFGNTQDLSRVERLPFSSPYERYLATDAEGNTKVFAEYAYDREGLPDIDMTTATDDTINVVKTAAGDTDIAGGPVGNGGTLDTTNFYRKITSNDGTSSVTINSPGIPSTITIGLGTWDGIIKVPSLITDSSQASKGESGLDGITPRQTYSVGADGASLTLNAGTFDLSLPVTDTNIAEGQIMNIYSSYNGSSRTNENKTCTVTAGKCNFSSSHLTLFTLGTTDSQTWNNLNFVNYRFRAANPTTGQIIDAFYGTGGSPSAYTTHRSGSCRPMSTGINIVTPGTRGAITLNANTIYILQSGTYIQTGTITMSNCSALIGSGTVTVKKSFVGNLVHASSVSGVILDNLQLDGSGNGNAGIEFDSSPSSAINDVQIYGNSGASHSYGIYLNLSNFILINNTQTYSNNNHGIFINQANYITINNIHSYNNANGIAFNNGSVGIAINNAQLYNNSTDGVIVIGTTVTGLTINNSQIYNNTRYGINLSTTSPNAKINNSRIFNNGTNPQVYSPAGSSGRYYGNIIAYPTAGFANFSAGSADTNLGRSTGALSSTDVGFSCDFVANPHNGGFLNSEFYQTSACDTIGAVPAWASTPIVKYAYGNNMVSGQYVLRQIQPVLWSPSLGLSSIPYHGHRFIGEYENETNRDINIPVAVFSGETPPNGTNVYYGIYSGYFSTRSFIFEPNLYSATRYDSISGTTAYNAVYDSGLVFMSNFDKVAEIGETTGLIKDLSLSYNYGVTGGTATRSNTGRRGGSYLFAGQTTTGYIEIPNVSGLRFTTGYTLAAWIYPHTIANYRGIFTRSDGIVNNIEVYFQAVQLVIVHNRGTGTISSLGTAWLPSTNQRTHLVLTYSGNTMSLYANGVYITGASGKTNPLNTNNVKRHIGEALTGGQAAIRFFDGQIDEPRIRNRALTSGEIDHLYHSNLSSKSDHREYAVNYTGVSARSTDFHRFGWSGASLYDGNTGTTSLQYVIKSTCTGSRRNNDNYITGGFWNHSPAPTDCDIALALYGNSTDGSDPTAYTQNRSGRTNQCNFLDASVVYLAGGTGTIPLTLAANTIYVLASGTYIQTGTINMATCSAIIGQAGAIGLYSTGYLNFGIIRNNAENYAIIDNIISDGSGDGRGGSHTKNSLGINLYLGNNTTINRFTTYNTSNEGIIISYSSNNIINNSEISKASYGIRTIQTTGAIISDSKTHDNVYYGIYFYEGNSNTVSGCQIYSNDDHGMHILNATNITIYNSQFYSNTGAGIYIDGAVDHVTFHNIQSYNNNYGLQTTNNANDRNYIAVNNSQFYSNANDGINVRRTAYFTLNNSHVYNNSGNGIYFAGSNNNSGVLSNVQLYNNGMRGIIYDGGTYEYYSTLKIFDNIAGVIYPFPSSNFTAGSGITYSNLGWATGNLDTNGCISCSLITNPTNTTLTDLIDTTIYPKCNVRGINSTWAATGNLDYKYGTSLTGQKLPVFWSGTSLTGSSLAYSGSQFVAEVNDVGTYYTNNQCSCLTHSYSWDNNNFLNSGFWNSGSVNTDYCEIIAALYGTGTSGSDPTAYTTNRSGWAGQCNTENMQVIFLTGGTDMITPIINTNTIYVLASGDYIQSEFGPIHTTTCNAMVGETGNIILYSDTAISTDGMIKAQGVQYNIFDNFVINGTGGGPVPNHGKNSLGIYIYMSGNNSLNNITAHNNGYGIALDTADNNVLNNIQTYNNDRGITVYYCKYNILNNIQAYNDSQFGIWLFDSANFNAFNNIQTYNNTQQGIYLGSASDSNAFNNIQTYNNGQNGIYLAGASGTLLNNVQSYNNGQYGIYNNDSYSRYYGTGALFADILGNTGGTVDVTQGTGAYFATLGRTTGNLIADGTISWDYITNPVDTNGNYLLPRTGARTEITGGQTNYTNVVTQAYSYGTGILTQIQPVYYSGSTLKTGGVYNSTKYIGSDLTKYTGSLSGLTSTVTTTGSFTVTGIANAGVINKYSLFGDIFAEKIGMTINTSTGIYLATGLGTKRVIMQIYSGTDFATHFQNNTELIDPCLSGRNNDNFIDSTFRGQNPSDANIICALYGSGGNDQTAYTKTRSGYNGSSCLSSMTVVHASNPNSVPLGEGATNFTIYVFPSGHYNFSSILDIGSCTAFISSGSTTITPNGNDYYMHFLRDSSIIDNIDIDGGGTSTYNVLFDTNGDRGNTIHAMNIYNAGSDGISIINSNYNLIDNNNIFNTNYGIEGDATSSYNTINNSNIYNNAVGVLINGSQSAVNNTLVYNNSNDGIVDYGDQTLINNCSIFNNIGYGIDSYGTNFTIARSKTYNNGSYGLHVKNTFVYYGDIVAFGNTTAYLFDSAYSSGTATPEFQWTDGSLYDDQGQFNQISNPLSWDYLMNPRDGNGNYMLPWTFTFASLQGSPGFSNVAPFIYSYGSGILLQSQPVIWDTTPTFIIGLTYNSGKYIGSDIYTYTGNLLMPAIVYTTGVTVTGQANANQISGYNLYGEDIISSITGETINQQTGIFFIAPDGIKNIVTQIYSPSYFATHFQKSAQLNTEISCASWRNNNNFITGYFRTAGTPTDENIICALYGTGPGDTTAYTQFRSGRDTTQCSGVIMNVVHTGHLSNLILAANTIYVLTGNVHTGNAAISMADCSTIISDESTGTTMYSTIMLDYTPGYEAMIYNANKKYTIVDNLNINGTGGGPVPAHAANYFGLDFESSTDSTISNLKTYNHTEDSIMLSACSNMLYNNIQSYDNLEGMLIDSVQNSIFNNMQVYNSSASFGMYIFSCANNAFNNIQIYNNQTDGLHVVQSTNNAFNNIQSYNNDYGIYIDSVSDNNIFNNTRGYNNINYGIWNDSNNIQYYGTAVFFNNANANISGSISLVQGTGNYYQSLGRQTGTIDTGATMSRDYITNPIDTNGNYLISRTGARTGIRGRQTGYTDITDKYSYGSGILTQIQPVYYSGSAFKTGGAFNSARYIGSSTIKVTGDVTGVNTYSMGTMVITGLSSNGLINKYSIFGDITAFKLGLNINTQSTGITLLTGLSTNRIVVQLSGTNYFSTHFQRETQTDSTPPSQVILISPLSGSVIPNPTVNLVRTSAIDTGVGMGTYLYQVSTGDTFTDFITSGTTANTGATINSLTIGTTYYRRVYAIDIAGNTGAQSDTRNFRIDIPISCMTGWDNDNFITDAFWSLNPSDENIICALYGSGGSDQTAYTKYRSGYIQASCLDQGMVVYHINPGTNQLPSVMSSNSIYVLSSGDYVQTGKINMKNCDTIVGKTGNAILYATGFDGLNRSIIENENKKNSILDNFSVNGSGSNPTLSDGLIEFSNFASDNTIHKIEAYENYYGIMLNNTNNNIFDTIKTHDNSIYGIFFYATANNNIFNNIQAFNNNNNGIYMNYSSNNTFTNLQIYDNGTEGIGVYYHSNNNIFNNMQIFNNPHNVFLGQSSGNIFNNTQVYNGGYAIDTNLAPNNIFNNIQVYNNQNGIVLDDESDNYIFNDTWIYNNDYGMRINQGSTGHRYYASGYFFGNTSDFGGSGENFIAGTGIYYSALGRTSGSMNTGISMSRDYATNPLNIDGTYLLLRSGSRTGVQGFQSNYATGRTEKYSYGSGIKTQIQPVLRSGNDIITGLSFDTTKYIGSIDTITVTGDATIVGTTITGISSNGLITKFSVFGDIVSYKIGQTINTSTGFIPITGLSANRIVTQLYDPSNYFATHFQKDLTIAGCILQFTGSTPADGATITGDNFRTDIEISSCSNLDAFMYKFDGVDYPYYDSGLVLMMNFDKIGALGETDGNIADRSQYGNNGSGYGGVTWTGNGKRGGAYKFNGTTNYIVTTSNISLGNTFSVGARVYASGTGVYKRIMETRYNSGFYLGMNANGTAYQLIVRNPTSPYGSVTGGNVVLNTRQYVLGVYDGTKGYLYVDGTLVDSGAFTAPGNTSYPLYIGRYPVSASYYRNGKIDEPRIWNRALSSGEVEQMYKSNLNKIDTGTWAFVSLQTGLLNNTTYLYTGRVSNVLGISENTGRVLYTNRCGNGTTDLGEQCDDGIYNTGSCTTGTYNGTCNYCSLSCTIGTGYGPYCGDSTITNPPETCDDGGTGNYDGCSASCQIEATGTIACSNGNFNFGSTGTSASNITLSALSDNVFQCVDMSGTTNGIYQVQMGTQLTNGITTISSGNVSIATGTVSEDCAGAVYASGGTLDNIINLMTKQYAGDRCTFGFTPTLSVIVPAWSSVGSYSGTMTITYPH